MNFSFANELNASFQLFLTNNLGYISSGISPYSGSLYSSVDPRYSSYNIYSSPFSQWNADSSVGFVPSGVYSNGNFVARGVSGLMIDYLRGRVLTTGALVNPTINYLVPDFNVYYTDNLDDPNILIETAFTLKPNIFQVTGALGYNSQVVPAIFYQSMTQENTAAALGKRQNANNVVECYVIATDTYQLDAAIGSLVDTARKYFPLVDIEDLPYNIYGDIKNGSYNYLDLISGQSRQVYIEKVTAEKYSEGKNKKIGRTVWGCKVKFELIYQFDNI